jgi:hypothetical protein
MAICRNYHTIPDFDLASISKTAVFIDHAVFAYFQSTGSGKPRAHHNASSLANLKPHHRSVKP